MSYRKGVRRSATKIGGLSGERKKGAKKRQVQREKEIRKAWVQGFG
jgi:hypothetical protein